MFQVRKSVLSHAVSDLNELNNDDIIGRRGWGIYSTLRVFRRHIEKWNSYIFRRNSEKKYHQDWHEYIQKKLCIPTYLFCSLLPLNKLFIFTIKYKCIIKILYTCMATFTWFGLTHFFHDSIRMQCEIIDSVVMIPYDWLGCFYFSDVLIPNKLPKYFLHNDCSITFFIDIDNINANQ